MGDRHLTDATRVVRRDWGQVPYSQTLLVGAAVDGPVVARGAVEGNAVVVERQVDTDRNDAAVDGDGAGGEVAVVAVNEERLAALEEEQVAVAKPSTARIDP